MADVIIITIMAVVSAGTVGFVQNKKEKNRQKKLIVFNICVLLMAGTLLVFVSAGVSIGDPLQPFISATEKLFPGFFEFIRNLS